MKIDATVDQMITEAEQLLVSTQTSITAQDFIRANQQVSQVRQLANQAYTSADEQARAIDQLYADLAVILQSVETSLTKVTSQQESLITVARTASTPSLVAQMMEKSAVARRAEAVISGEDHALAQDLKDAISAYQAVLDLTAQVLASIESDRLAYQGHLQKAQNSIKALQLSIEAAVRLVNHSDANGAGSHALRTAQKLITSMPAECATIDALVRTVSETETVQEWVRRAQAEAQSAIQQAEDEREAERRRLALIAAAAASARRAEEEEERRARERQRQSSSSSSSSHSSSMGSSSSRSSSSMGSSSSRSSSSMGSSRRR
jgi:hypothetical protein